MDLDLEEIGLMLVNNYALLPQNYTSINTLIRLQEIYIIDACVEHIKYIEQTSLALGVFK